MTNDPPYDQQLALLQGLDFSHPSSDTPLPGNVAPTDRFARASYYAALLPEPRNEREAVAGVLAIARNVSVPFGAPYKGFGIYNTEYRTVSDLTHGRYFFELTTAPTWCGPTSAGSTSHRARRSWSSTPMTSRSRATSRRGSPRRRGHRSDGVAALGGL